MANNIFEKWNKNIDTEGLQKDVKEAAENSGGNYKEVPHGNYEVSVEKMELVASKKGDPMVSIWFKVVSEGEFKGSMIFYNQVVTQGFQIYIVNELLREMLAESADAPKIDFVDYQQYAELIMDCHEAIENNFEYHLEYGTNKKGYNTFEVLEVYVLED